MSRAIRWLGSDERTSQRPSLRLPTSGLPIGHPGAPKLVIEVLSPSNTVAEIIDKKTLCLENGSHEFWVVDIEHRQVEVSTPDGRGKTYKSGQHIPLFFAADAQLAVDAIFS